MLSKKLLQWHKKVNTRSLPWNTEKNPYRIWISEILLQQTKANAVIPYYKKFIYQYPTIIDLANAEENQIFLLWQGLGYYSRCRNLLATAKVVKEKYNGIFPIQYDDIIALPGIGPYTASAIASFAYNLPYAVLDGNVYRILSRLFGIDTPIDSASGKIIFQNKATELLPKSKAALYNQAIMDLGATICKPKSPICTECPWNLECVAFKNKETSFYPVKNKQLIIKNRFFHYFVFDDGENLYINKRIQKDIWQDLHQFALIETLDATLTVEKGIWIQVPPLQLVQKLTHQNIFGYFYTILQMPDKKRIKKFQLIQIPYHNIAKYAWPNMMVRFLKMQGFI